ncbi:NAD(+) diphosphatase [Crenobacter cavernae]|uniref:NAD(+) diphosphatase n=1 Tax=Crenobacter cavernae TaxID=2290923 RepID=A0ABY0FBW9_9NEIS|nr:NAD(+) diphosphatase [Crenobacter cavernae]RXZ42106.1 NAD(+) diphosphatase [Crenobacter cavernae]
MPFVLPATADPALPCRFCLFDGQSVLLVDGALPGNAAARWPVAGRRFLGVHENANLFCGELVGTAPAGVWLPVRAALMQLPEADVPALSRAVQIRRFQKTHRLCGACGGPLAQHAHDQGRGCASCGEVYYPRVSPAMMLTITRGNEILLARSPHFTPGVYSAIAGFVEPGETLEDCVRRECFEEVGIRIGEPVYLGSQSWPFPHSLMLAFTAEYAGGELTPQEGEIEDARWFARDALPAIPPKPSIANWLIVETLAKMAAR